MTNGGGRSAAQIPVHIDRGLEVPLPVQLAAALREAIDRGDLRPGEMIPASRALAARVGVARGVVVAAYEQLRGEGYLTAAHGSGTRVTPDLPTLVGPGPADPAGPGGNTGRATAEEHDPGTPGLEALIERGPLAPGVPITDAVDSPAWRAAWRAAAARAHVTAPPLGDPALRAEIAEHLRRMRGTARSGSDVLVTAGTRDGLGLLLTALGARNRREIVIGVEDPGLPSLRGAATRLGARSVALPADAEGLDTSALPEGLLDAVIVTPSHQYPLGGTLPLPRRRELLAWAQRTGVVVIEDDYDSELRYTGSALPTLAALDDPAHGSVVLLGTFSRTISPALSAGYLLAPANLRALIEPARHELGGPVSAIVQSALTGYLASGQLRRHTARMLRRYAARRDLVSDLLAGARGVRVRPMDGGLHAVIEFTGTGLAARRAREQETVTAAARERLGAQALGSYWQRRGPEAGIAGLVIGMGGPDDNAFADALGRLREIVDRA